ncbi:putative fatty-acid--CoA ligase [Gordonia hirsuta DSM 44140 = NBRC 16056]|uniref:Putative fatty-acid--CoA ligase n=1 Tax=Gordonia hirsuta DSM 44140 = NBRC 16056 TaxID=1121927 RepID=L7L977_9ACTN|nr:class I adenylate-forming enzyme family protein [Gordonia hirsuta]GAC56578.1 putative fatty-acid--CoA ligase [Gordonia hirsuta DSM 44140 = NBRC 16056]
MPDLTQGLYGPDKIARFRKTGAWTDATIDQVFTDRVAERPDAVALVDPANNLELVGTAPRRLTWRELDDEVTALAARLLDAGIEPFDVIGVHMPNGIELVELYLAAWRIGAVVSPLAMQYREYEIVTMGVAADFAAMVTVPHFGDRETAAEALALAECLPNLKFVATLTAEPAAEPVDGAVAIVSAPAGAADRERVAAHDYVADPNHALTICWTSGTESAPKGVPRAHYDWLSFAWAGVDAPRLTGDDVLLNPFPMINMAAFVGKLLPWLHTGATLVQHQPFDASTFFGQIVAEKVTYTVAPPALLLMLLRNEELRSRLDLSSLSRVGSGSAPLQPVTVRGWQEEMGIAVINFFGSNEGIGLLSSPEDFPDPDDRARYFPRYGAPGITWASRVSEWITLKLVDQDTGEEITEPGRVGELHIDGPMVFAGYLNGEQLASPFDDEGFLRSGELFQIEGEHNQYLRYVDRAKDLIVRGGMNIAPAELEALISAHPAVAEVAVIGRPCEVMGERVHVVLSLQPESALELPELVSFLKQRQIASYKLPESLEVLPVLPRNPVGKLLKRDLRAALVP